MTEGGKLSREILPISLLLAKTETHSLDHQVQPYKLVCAWIPEQVNGISHLGAGMGPASHVG